MTHQGLNLNKIEARGRFNTVMFIDLLENLQRHFIAIDMKTYN